MAGSNAAGKRSFSSSSCWTTLRRPRVSDVAERPTTKRREADPEHGADVSVLRSPQHTLLEAAGRLVDHGQHRTALNFRSLITLRCAPVGSKP